MDTCKHMNGLKISLPEYGYLSQIRIIGLTLKCPIEEVPLLSHRPTTPTTTTPTTITSQFFGGKFKFEMENANANTKCKMLFNIKNSAGSAFNPLCQRTC